MFTPLKSRYKACLILALFGIALFSYSVHQRHLRLHAIFCQVSSVPESLENLHTARKIQSRTGMVFPKAYVPFVEPSPMKADWNDTEEQVKMIISEINKVVPKVTFTHMDNTTCIGKSRASIVNPKERYCIGDKVTVQLDMHDYSGNRKKYGGDLLRARIYSQDISASASGKISDFQNGTYHVEFTLFWAGKVKISLLLIHPSEAVVALWRGRNTGFNLVGHKGKYTSPTQSIDTQCGYDLDTKDEVCEYMEKKDEYPFYCIKPPDMPCASLTMVASWFTQNSYLTTLEKPLHDSSLIRAAIPHGLPDLDVISCTNETAPVNEKCKTGMEVQFPGGYFLQNVWHPISCSMTRYTAEAEINGCLKGKSLHLIGDSTLIQWMRYFAATLPALKDLNLYGSGWQKSLLFVDVDRNIQIRFQKHGDPFVSMTFYSILENPTIPEQIDRIGGHQNMVIIFTAGTHFKGFPLHIFIRRVINIRKSIQRLLLRSPATKVILKTENTSLQDNNFEKISDFHGYIQYLIMNSLMKGLNIATIDTWDMTTAFASNNVHPPPIVIENEISLLLTFLC